MPRRKRRSNTKRRRNAIKLANPRRARRRANPRRRRNAGMKLKFDMGSMLIGAGLAYYFHHKLKDLVGDILPMHGQAQAAGSISQAELEAIEAQAEAEVAAEEAMDLGAIHMNPSYGAIHMNPNYGAIHMNPAHLHRNMHHM